MSIRDSVLIAKLKDGIQEIIVFLRMLEGAKLSPVYDRKRRQLMDKLLDLQGDTRRGAPPKFDEDDVFSTPTSPERMDESRASIISEGEGVEIGERSLPRRSSKILGMREKFEQPSSERPNYYKTLDQLKKTSPVHKDDGSSTEKSQQLKEEGTLDNEQEAVEEEKEESFEMPEDIPDAAETNEDKRHRKEKKDKKHRGAFFTKLLGPKKDRSDSVVSPVGSQDSLDQAGKENKEDGSHTPPSEETPTEEKPTDDSEQEPVDDKDVPLVAVLDRVLKRLGRTTRQQVQLVLQGTLVKMTKLSSKEKDREAMEMDLTTSATAQRDNLHFEIFTTSKSYTFRAQSEEQCSKWTARLMETIKSCTPDQPEEELVSSEQQEEQPVVIEAPQITVMAEDGSEVPPSTQECNTMAGSSSYENIAFDKRRRKIMPEISACLVRSCLYRKGTFGWDKVWCVLTQDNTLYITNSESSKKPQQVLSIGLQSKVEKKRGTDKYPNVLQLMVGGKRELLASDNTTEFLRWLSLLETATGCANIEELLSEDEGGDLYEDLPDMLDSFSAPVIPSSPRPAQRPIPVPVEDDNFDGDIYEGVDDLDLPPLAPPALPKTVPPKHMPSTTLHQPLPTLPPRNTDAPPPSLPPRPSAMPSKPQDYEPAKPSPPISKKIVPPLPVEDEVYDDVVAPIEEETYDDVVVPVAQEEETYDDVVVPVNEMDETYDDIQVGIMEEFYEEMGGGEGYVSMSKNSERKEERMNVKSTTHGSVSEESYTEADMPSSRPPPPKTSQLATASSSRPPSTPTGSLTRTAAKVSYTPTRPAPPPSISKTPLVSSPTAKQSPAKGQSPLTPKVSATSVTSTRPFSATTPAPNKTPGTGAPKKLQTSGKVATLSRMFQQDDKQPHSGTPKGSQSGSLLYKSPSKPSFVSEWCMLEGSMLQFFSAAGDLRSHYKFSVRDAELSMAEVKSGQFGFHIAKGTVVHQFTTTSKEELDAWLVALAPVVQKCFPPNGSTYQAKEDHAASGENEVSFKRDDFVWVLSKESAQKWTGIVGSSENKYQGPCGQFPSAKVREMLMEDPYI